MFRTQHRSGRGLRDFQYFSDWSREFEARFGTETACRDHLYRTRWPDGFVCWRCGPARFRWKDDRRLTCLRCHKDTALTGGTILHGTRKPLKHWFRAVFLMVQFGVNARVLQTQLDLTYKVAWTWAQKLRRVLSVKTTLDAPWAPFDFDFKVEHKLPTGERQRRIWFATHGHFQWEATREGGLGVGCERLVSADWNAQHSAERLVGSTLYNMFSSYSGSLSDKFLRAYMDEAEFRVNHQRERKERLVATVAEVTARFAAVRPYPYHEIRGDRRKRPPLRVRPPRLETVPATWPGAAWEGRENLELTEIAERHPDG